MTAVVFLMVLFAALAVGIVACIVFCVKRDNPGLGILAFILMLVAAGVGTEIVQRLDRIDNNRGKIIHEQR